MSLDKLPLEQEEIFDVFLSHSHHDEEIIELIAKKLVDEAGKIVWLDKWVLIPGEHWQQEMAKGLDHAKTCAVFIGKQTPRGWFQEEIERAINRQSHDKSFRVIPVILPDGDQTLVDNFLELRTWINFKNGIDDNDEFYRFLSGINGISPGRIQLSSNEEDLDPASLIQVRQNLRKIRMLKQEQLIGGDIEQEYQRKLLDKLFFG